MLSDVGLVSGKLCEPPQFFEIGRISDFLSGKSSSCRARVGEGYVKNVNRSRYLVLPTVSHAVIATQNLPDSCELLSVAARFRRHLGALDRNAL